MYVKGIQVVFIQFNVVNNDQFLDQKISLIIFIFFLRKFIKINVFKNFYFRTAILWSMKGEKKFIFKGNLNKQ